MNSDVYTTAEAADMLRVSKYTICRYIKDGILPAAQTVPGSQYLIPATAIHNLLTPTPTRIDTGTGTDTRGDQPLHFGPRNNRSAAQRGRQRRKTTTP